MLARWPALLIQAATTSSGEGYPAAIFSPHIQIGEYPAAHIRPQAEEPSEPVWLKKSFSAISRLWASAAAFSAGSLTRGGRPTFARSWLVSSITRSANVAAEASGPTFPPGAVRGGRRPSFAVAMTPDSTGGAPAATATAAVAMMRISSPRRRPTLPGPRTRNLLKIITTGLDGVHRPASPAPESARASMPLVGHSAKSCVLRVIRELLHHFALRV